MEQSVHHERSFEQEGAKTLIIFTHGINGSPRQFDELLSAYRGRASVIAPLLPGHGKTGRDFSRSCMDEWQAHIDRLLERSAARYPNILLVGHSLGCLLSIDAALRNKGTVKGLFLIAPPLHLRLQARGALRALKVALRIGAEDEVSRAAKSALSTEQKGVLGYALWLPRYVELYHKGASLREAVKAAPLPPLRAVFALHDEYVSPRSKAYFEARDSSCVFTLNHSGHYYYPPQDKERLHTLLREFIGTLGVL